MTSQLELKKRLKYGFHNCRQKIALRCPNISQPCCTCLFYRKRQPPSRFDLEQIPIECAATAPLTRVAIFICFRHRVLVPTVRLHPCRDFNGKYTAINLKCILEIDLTYLFSLTGGSPLCQVRWPCVILLCRHLCSCKVVQRSSLLRLHSCWSSRLTVITLVLE